MIQSAFNPANYRGALNDDIHQFGYPVWIFDEDSLKIVDANKKAIDFCQYEQHDLIGLSIMELWHNQDLLNILNDLVHEHFQRSFFGHLKHRKKSGEMVVMKVRAVRLTYSNYLWAVHLVQEDEGALAVASCKATLKPAA